MVGGERVCFSHRLFLFCPVRFSLVSSGGSVWLYWWVVSPVLGVACVCVVSERECRVSCGGGYWVVVLSTLGLLVGVWLCLLVRVLVVVVL